MLQSKFKISLLAIAMGFVLTGCGLDGDDGVVGEAGSQGPQGEPGADGADGQDGQDGQSGQDASTGVTLSLVARAFLGAQGSAEIVQYHKESQTIYATNSATNSIAIIAAGSITSADLTNPINSINLTVASINLPATAGTVPLGKVTSIAISGDLLAVAVPAATKTDNGFILFYNGLANSAPAFLDSVEVGALPDSIAFTPDGGKLVVANEGEPNGDYSIDPEGTLSVIDILANGEPEETADTVTFTSLNGTQAELEAQGMHFPNPDGLTINGNAITTTVAQDLEPEYVSTAIGKAYVTLQENNGLAILDLEDLSVQVIGLGSKSWSGLNFDGQENGAVSFAKYEGLNGVYMPDSIANYEWKGATFLVTANEGDAREYFFDVADEEACTTAMGQSYDAEAGCLSYSDEVKLEDLTAQAGSALETLQMDGRLNGLRVTKELGDADGNGEYESAYTYGARSFTIWDQNGLVVFDSADDLERITASVHGAQFNNDNDVNEGDSRSENKGPEPEALTVGTIGARTYAFIGAERMSGIFVYDVTNPFEAFFADYIINRDLTEGSTANDVIGDLAPESIVFVPAEDSATGEALIIVGNEVSGTVSVFQVTPN
ncbi:choice-of-anchor I family protein [Brumicola nitratireducens]|uniref:Putative alkaline phosphatase n=1 Tax=Glaciecola nitratireducens (strain JCM 12485 / KCTC 12276 / FR1064) TaxID=1085623 RepID=G4QMP3_GLANF|nr:choice-of-anchor I family protein [Glaciecola nitratireducens]AEP30814.1 putative alkaline phosphatase [Glaciecola nitratireducens FR1064]